jgi:hypothetical protein
MSREVGEMTRSSARDWASNRGGRRLDTVGDVAVSQVGHGLRDEGNEARRDYLVQRTGAEEGAPVRRQEPVSREQWGIGVTGRVSHGRAPLGIDEVEDVPSEGPSLGFRAHLEGPANEAISELGVASFILGDPGQRGADRLIRRERERFRRLERGDGLADAAFEDGRLDDAGERARFQGSLHRERPGPMGSPAYAEARAKASRA